MQTWARGEFAARAPGIDWDACFEGATLSATDDHTLDLEIPRAMDLNRVFATLGEAGIRVRSMRTKSNRLEELFVRLTSDNLDKGPLGNGVPAQPEQSA